MTCSKPKRRKYTEDYVQYGFTVIMKGEVMKPQCVICATILSEHSMKPSLLKRHLQTQHPQDMNKQESDSQYFIRKAESFNKGKLDSTGQYFKLNESATYCSYLVSYKLAKAKQSHTLAEKVIIPCCIDIAENLFNQDCPGSCTKDQTNSSFK